MDAYVDALCRELALRHPDKPLQTVYFGGGTPSLLSYGQLQRIVDAIREYCDVSQLEEVTLEANPENLTRDYLEMLASVGFLNRLSIGIQSFHDDELRLLNRVHSRRQAMDAVAFAADAGFRNVSVDLIMGLPGQSAARWEDNLQLLASLMPLNVVNHLSCYELTLEPGSILERQLQMGRVRMADETVLTSQYEMLQQWCETNGFQQYEVSNYCRPGYHSRHNSRYWDRTPYVGVGAGAHSFDGRCRRWNLTDITAYEAGAERGEVPHEEEELTAKDAFNEYLMTALRTRRGVQKEKIDESFRGYLSEQMARFVRARLIEETDTAYRPTDDGLLRADGIAAELFML